MTLACDPGGSGDSAAMLFHSFGSDLVIVEFFAAIGVSDVSPALVAHGVIVLPQRGNGDMLPIRVWVFEQRLETDTFEPGIRRLRPQRSMSVG